MRQHAGEGKCSRLHSRFLEPYKLKGVGVKHLWSGGASLGGVGSEEEPQQRKKLVPLHLGPLLTLGNLLRSARSKELGQV